MAILTIATPVYEQSNVIKKVIEANRVLYTSYPLVIVNRRGGGQFTLEPFSLKYFDMDTPFWQARKFMLNHVETEYVFCLDADNVLPIAYVDEALGLLERERTVACVAVNYAVPFELDHLGFGTSIWRTSVLRRLYDWVRASEHPCECKYMWARVEAEGLKVATLPFQASRLRSTLGRSFMLAHSMGT